MEGNIRNCWLERGLGAGQAQTCGASLGTIEMSKMDRTSLPEMGNVARTALGILAKGFPK